MSREDVFIANVLKSRPPGNRDPQPDEIEACRPYLFEQVRLIEPKVVCTLGNFATKLLSGNPTGITRVRGTPQVHELGGRTVFLLPLFHPAAALRTPAVKETLRGDFATIPALLGRPLPGAEPEEPEEEAEEALPRTPRGLPTTSRWTSLASRLHPARPRRRKRSGPRSPPASARGRRRRLRRARGRQDDPGPRRLPGAGGDRAGHLADLHDRPALRRPGRRRLPPRPLPAGRAGGRGPGAARRLPGRRTDRLRRVARRGVGRLERPALDVRIAHGGGDDARSSSTPHLQALSGVRRHERPCSIGRQQVRTSKEGSASDEGTEDADGAAGGHRVDRGRGARGRQRRRLQPLRRLRGLAERETGPRLPDETRQGRLLQKQQPTVFYTVCVTFPNHTNLCAPKQEAVQGTLYVNKITSKSPASTGSAGSSKAKKSAPPSSAYRSNLALLGFDTATQDTAVCAARRRRRGPARVPARPPADGSPGHTTRLLDEVEAVGRGRRGLGADRVDRGRPRPRLLHRAAGRDRDRAGARRLARPAAARGRHPRRDRRRIGERAGEEGDGLAVIDARRGEVFASLHSPSGKPVWGPWVGSPQELGGEALPVAADRSGWRFGGGTIS